MYHDASSTLTLPSLQYTGGVQQVCPGHGRLGYEQQADWRFLPGCKPMRGHEWRDACTGHAPDLTWFAEAPCAQQR